MLHHFPADPFFHEAEDLRHLEKQPPSSEEEAIGRLCRLLPELGDDIIPVWSSPIFPFQPVAVVSFVDKQGEPLVAVACESGLLAVSCAKNGKEWEYLQVPKVWRHRGRIQGLWASQAARPFDSWTELLVLILPREPAEAPTSCGHMLYRALVRTRAGHIELHPALEDPGSDATHWGAVCLPPRFEWLSRGRTFCNGGADLFDPSVPLNAHAEAAADPGNLVVRGRTHVVWVENRDRLMARPSRDAEPVSVHLDNHVQALVCLPSQGDVVRLVVTTDRRRLEAWELDGSEWEMKWGQPLRHRLLAIDCAVENETSADTWPDFFVTTNIREVVRLEQVGPGRLWDHWRREVRHLHDLVEIQGAGEWIRWCRKRLDEKPDTESDEDRSRHQLFHYLALDRLLAEPKALAVGELRQELGRLYAAERKPALLLPVFRRLKRELKAWEKKRDTALPELAWVCYHMKPFRVQEILDIHFRGIPEERRLELQGHGGKGFEELCQRSRDVVAFFEPREPRRRAGLHLLRAIESFVTAAFSQEESDVVYRHLVPLSLEEGQYFVAVSERQIDLFRFEETEHTGGENPSREARLERIGAASTRLKEEPPCVPEFAVAVRCSGGRELVLFGTRHGRLAIWDPGLVRPSGSTQPSAKLYWLEEQLEGSLTSAALVPGTGGSDEIEGTLFVAESRSSGSARLLKIGLGSRCEPVLRATWDTELSQIRALEVYQDGEKYRILAGEHADVVLLGIRDGEDEVQELGRRHLGSTLVGLSLVREKDGAGSLFSCCTRNGFLYAIIANPDIRPWRRVRWNHQVTLGVTRMISRLRGTGRIGVIDAQGNLALFDSEGAVELWRQLHDPAEAAAFLPGQGDRPNYLVVAHESGSLTLLRATDGVDNGIRRAREALASKGDRLEDEEIKNNETWQMGRALERFNSKEPLAALYNDLDFPAARRSLAWLVARQPNLSKRSLKDLVKKLDLEDHALLLQETQDTGKREILEKAAWMRIARSQSSMGRKIEAWEIRQLARLLEVLLRSARKSARPISQEHFTQLPGELFEQSDWVCHLVAGRIVATIGHEINEPDVLLERLLTFLVRFPLSVAQAAATFASGGEQSLHLENTLRGWVQLGEALRREAKPEETQTALRDLAEALASWKKQEAPAVILLEHYIAFLANTSTSDPSGRFQALLEILTRARAEARAETLLGWLFRRMAAWLPRDHPGDDAFLESQAKWLRDASNRLRARQRDRDELQQDLDELIKPHDDWDKLLDHLLRQGRRIFLELIEQEEDRLRSEARLHLQVVANRRSSKFVAELGLTLTPDALRRTEGLHYVLEFTGPGGLGNLGTPLRFEDTIEIVDPRRRREAERFEVRGSVGAVQESVRAVVQLDWAGGGHHVTEVELALQRPDAEISGAEAPLPDAVSSWTEALVERIRKTDRGSMMVILDEELGRAGLVRRCEEPGSWTIDLDRALHDVGPGRAFPNRLTLANFRLALRGETVPVDEEISSGLHGAGSILFVEHCDDTWHRLLADPGLKPVLHEIVNFIDAPVTGSPRIVFFVGYEIGQVLRRQFANLKFIEAQRLPDESELAAAWEESAVWLTRTWPSTRPELGRNTLRTLGGDLRLALALRRIPENELSPGALEPQVAKLLRKPEVERVLRSDLAGLPPRTVQLLMVAACSWTTLRFNQVEAGMVAAEEFHSTPRHGGRKLIFRIGDQLGGRAIRALQADPRYHDRSLRLEGFSLEGLVETETGFRHFADFLGSGKQFRRQTDLLARLGLVEEVSGLVRVRQPYCGWITSSGAAGRSPTQIYRQFTGESSALGELSFAELCRLPPAAMLEIQPSLVSDQAEAVHTLATAWTAIENGREASPTDLRRIFRKLTGRTVEILAGVSLSTPSPEWTESLLDERDLLFGLGETTPQGGYQYYLLILVEFPAPSPMLMNLVQKRGGEASPKGRLIVLRPGRPERSRSEQRWIELSDERLREAALHHEYQKAFWGQVRAEGGLTALAPFQKEGALLPGSQIFFGREDELEIILEQAHKRSFLIVGSRQIGKTSLLNQVRFHLEKRDNLRVYHFDLQKGKEEFRRLLLPHIDGAPDRKAEDLLHAVITRDRQSKKTPIILLNEIDAMIMEDPAFLRFLRGFNDDGEARFVMTGYFQASAACTDPTSPFFHWTSSHDGRPYMVLDELSDPAARSIVALLRKPPLELVWEEGDEEEGVRSLLERSYRIPHLLQALCLGLVARLENKQRPRLRASDVEAVAQRQEYSAWDRATKIDFGKLVYGVSEMEAVAGMEKEKANVLVDLLLLIAVKKLYFQGAQPPIQSKSIRERDPKFLGFDAKDLRTWFPEVLGGLFRGEEFAEAEILLMRIDLEALLFGLSLTLVLSFDPETKQHYFQSHLYPIELQRQLSAGELIDDRILKQLMRFHSFVADRGDSKLNAPNMEHNGSVRRYEWSSGMRVI